MYLTPLMTTLTKAMKDTFDADYPVEEFRQLRVGVEYPITTAEYPGIWVDYTPTQDLVIAGIGHAETIESEGDTRRQVLRWRFFGEVSYTAVSFSSLERHRLVDEIVRVIAFGRQESSTATFRNVIEDNDFIAVNINFDSISQSGFSVNPGTPWGTQDLVYEGTVTLGLQGEFISDPITTVLVPLSAVEFLPYRDGEPDPEPDGSWS